MKQLLVFVVLIALVVYSHFTKSANAQSCEALPGDANHDCVVNLKDYAVWRLAYFAEAGNQLPTTSPTAGPTAVPVAQPSTHAADVKKWDDVLYPQLPRLTAHILAQIEGKDATPGSGGAYSSALGLGVYHTMDEMTALAYAIENSPDPVRRAAYAEAAVKPLDIITNALNTLNFRYLDESHGVGGVGFVLNAIHNDPTLRVKYDSQLKVWAQKIKPILNKNKDRLVVSEYPHMSANIAPGFLAVGKILGERQFIDDFIVLRKGILAQIKASGWVGDNNDVSHTSITVQVLHLAYKEQQRGVLDKEGGVTATQLSAFAKAFAARSSLAEMNYGFPVLVLSDPALHLQAKNIQVVFTDPVGTHLLARHFNTAAGLMAGYNTK